MTLTATQPQAQQDTSSPPPSVARRVWAATSRFRPVLALDLVLIVTFASTTEGFLTRSNVDNLLTSVSIIWLIAMGMTFVLLSGGFDLSAGAVATVSGIALAKMLSAGVPGGLAIAITVVVGALIGGLVNGLLVGRLRLSVFVVTLASMTALTGLATIWTETQTVPVTENTVLSLVVNRIAGQPIIVWLMLLSFLVVLFLQQRTQFGRNVFAVGGNEKAAALSGIRTGRVLIAVYALVGAAAAIGGIIADGRIGGAAPQVDNTLPLQAIAAVLIGGTSLLGGVGGSAERSSECCSSASCPTACPWPVCRPRGSRSSPGSSLSSPCLVTGSTRLAGCADDGLIPPQLPPQLCRSPPDQLPTRHQPPGRPSSHHQSPHHQPHHLRKKEIPDVEADCQIGAHPGERGRQRCRVLV